MVHNELISMCVRALQVTAKVVQDLSFLAQLFNDAQQMISETLQKYRNSSENKYSINNHIIFIFKPIHPGELW